MNLEFSSAIDPEAAAEALTRRRRVQVRDILPAEVAEALAERIADIENWDLALTGSSGPYKVTHADLARMPQARRARMLEELRRQSRSGFSFAYYRRDVLPGDDPVLPEFADWASTASFLDFMRALTGRPEINRADAHATRYQVGSFLKSHDDTYAGKNRRFAYVLNLTREWQGDWGGLLHFEDDDGELVECFLPHFNSLSVFAVPQAHFVSQVATYARRSRYAVTGWLFAD